jgi:hypothetical protein
MGPLHPVRERLGYFGVNREKGKHTVTYDPRVSRCSIMANKTQCTTEEVSRARLGGLVMVGALADLDEIMARMITFDVREASLTSVPLQREDGKFSHEIGTFHISPTSGHCMHLCLTPTMLLGTGNQQIIRQKECTSNTYVFLQTSQVARKDSVALPS